MRDLLKDLVRRTLEPESTVQPRLLSRYEEPASSAAHPLEEDEHAATARPTVTMPSAPGIAAEAGRAATGHGEPVEAQRQVPRRVEPPGSTEHGLRAIVERRIATAPPAAPSPIVAVAQRPLDPSSPGRTEPSRSVLEPVPHRRAIDERTISRIVERVKPAEAPQTQGTARATASDPLSAPAPESPAAAPDVRISIGRIEIRATGPARPAARSARSERPRQSLEEYLAERAQRGRR